MARRSFYLLSGAGITAIAATHIVTSRIPVESSSLLSRRVESEKVSNPSHEYPIDLFQLELPGINLDELKNSENSVVDTYLHSFVTSPVFTLERLLLKSVFGESRIIPVTTASYPIGKELAIWKVTDKNTQTNEVLLKWKNPIDKEPYLFGGMTYLRIMLNDNKGLILQFGSALDIKQKLSYGSYLSMKAHFVYSRILLLNLALKLKWDKLWN
ncbi:hypothetical protein HK096_009664 [Nowakowskiella sp. JEL0078]|nr:hypothetical protein HK096_009664 [Nowakowskiella sp. JEL0078]